MRLDSLTLRGDVVGPTEAIPLQTASLASGLVDFEQRSVERSQGCGEIEGHRGVVVVSESASSANVSSSSTSRPRWRRAACGAPRRRALRNLQRLLLRSESRSRHFLPQ